MALTDSIDISDYDTDKIICASLDCGCSSSRAVSRVPLSWVLHPSSFMSDLFSVPKELWLSECKTLIVIRVVTGGNCYMYICMCCIVEAMKINRLSKQCLMYSWRLRPDTRKEGRGWPLLQDAEGQPASSVNLRRLLPQKFGAFQSSLCAVRLCTALSTDQTPSKLYGSEGRTVG